MLQIGNSLVSLDLLEKKFSCNLSKCKGACCVQGDSGAPLEDEEVDILNQEYENIEPFMNASGKDAVAVHGKWQTDSDGDKVTTLVNQKECVFVVFEKGVAVCAIEKAFLEGKTSFRKPVSCHLYPVRLTKYSSYVAVNYHSWEVCKPAVKIGNKLEIPLYIFLKDALIRKFGKDWYHELDFSAREYMKFKEQQ